jgi:uncharacterized surface anchored protein
MRKAAPAALLLFGLNAFCQQAPAPSIFKLAGVIVDAATNAPLAGAEVEVAPVGKPQLIEVAVADGAGRFEFDNLFAGKYNLSAVHAGYLQTGYHQHGMYATAIVTGPAFDNTRIVFPLVRKASVSGTITDQDGEPVPNATVHLLRRSVVEGLRAVRGGTQGRTGNDGRYTLGNLQPGEYFMAVTAQPWYALQMAAMGQRAATSDTSGKLDVAYPLTFFPGVTGDESAAALAVAPGARLEANLALTAMPAAHVTIERSHGANTNARLQAATRWGFLIPAPGMFFSPQGQTFNVAPGRYRLLAGWRDATGPHSIRHTVEVRGSMTLDPKSIEDQRSLSAVFLNKGASERQRPGSLGLRDLETLEILRPTASRDQTFRWPADELTGNRYELVFNSPEDLYVDRVTANNARVTGRVLELGSGGPVQVKVSLGHGRSSMTGKVEQNGAPVAGAMVLLLPEDFTAPGLIRRDQSDGDGSFSLSDITPGRYILLALEANDDLEYAKAEAMQPYLSRGKQIVIEPGRKYQETAAYVGAAR